MWWRGSVRYCRGTLADSWVSERLLVRDEKQHLCQYQMEENRFRFRDGLQGYVSQIQVTTDESPLPALLKNPEFDVNNGRVGVSVNYWWTDNYDWY